MMRVLLGLAFAVLLGVPIPAQGGQYPGWSDTGWMYASKRECCNAALAIASEYSAQACITAGGVPRSFRGGAQRGTCNPQWMQDDSGALLYRCSAEVSVWCR
jgi:hypothetical protein